MLVLLLVPNLLLAWWIAAGWHQRRQRIKIAVSGASSTEDSPPLPTDTKTGVAEAKPKASSQTDVHPQATAAAAVVSQAAVSSTTVSSSTDKASSVSALGAVHFVVAVAAIVSGGVGIQKVAAEGQQSASVPILGSSGAAPAPTQRVVPVFDKAEFEAVLKGVPAVREVSSVTLSPTRKSEGTSGPLNTKLPSASSCGTSFGFIRFLRDSPIDVVNSIALPVVIFSKES